ncbi:hypothetical protein MIH18_23535 (plasmid) [Marinobacter sp. M3C]|jgi:hypothetical protein|uniref:hypothetical protein n=1 Tax=Marinobacter sp. M3C TaxID=2917715 RepID=UPI002010236B|nr:hypothetical protein [Marinobacter sp. M3C]MCL1485170.1 hypothetical protein [Marinobacter sp.]UQG62805.1 hypothetical protein MIH18_23535 [Marinobacter sp. M3C]
MALTPAQRKRRQRESEKALGMKPFRMDLAASERAAIEVGAQAGGYEDQTEYLLDLVYKDRDTSQKEQTE